MEFLFLSSEIQWNMKLQHWEKKKIMTFLISFLQLKFSSFFCWFIFSKTFSVFFSSLAEASKFSSLWELTVYVGGWMCDGILCCLLLSLFLYLLSFIFNLDLKGKTLCFMYSSYVISSFLITNHLQQILFRFSRKAASREIINCILPSRFMKKLRKMKMISFGLSFFLLDNSTLFIDFILPGIVGLFVFNRTFLISSSLFTCFSTCHSQMWINLIGRIFLSLKTFQKNFTEFFL